MAIVTIIVTALLMIIFSLLFAYYKFIKLRRVIADDEEGFEHQGPSLEALPVCFSCGRHWNAASTD